jgi:hypothetical protein
MTTDTDKHLSDAELDILFEQARDVNGAPSEDLLARIMADADAEMPRTAPKEQPILPSNAPGFFSVLLSQIGGMAGAAGLAAAGVSGLLIGFADLGLQDIAAQAIGLEIVDYDLSDLYPDFSSSQEDI